MLPIPSPSVICQQMENGAVLFAPETEFYFGLNETGVAIWELLTPAGGTRSALCAELGKRYPDVDPHTLASDVDEILQQFVAEGLATAR